MLRSAAWTSCAGFKGAPSCSSGDARLEPLTNPWRFRGLCMAIRPLNGKRSLWRSGAGLVGLITMARCASVTPASSVAGTSGSGCVRRGSTHAAHMQRCVCATSWFIPNRPERRAAAGIRTRCALAWGYRFLGSLGITSEFVISGTGSGRCRAPRIPRSGVERAAPAAPAARSEGGHDRLTCNHLYMNLHDMQIRTSQRCEVCRRRQGHRAFPKS